MTCVIAPIKSDNMRTGTNVDVVTLFGTCEADTLIQWECLAYVSDLWKYGTAWTCNGQVWMTSRRLDVNCCENDVRRRQNTAQRRIRAGSHFTQHMRIICQQQKQQ